jgi:hypothetical protein
MCVGDDVKIEKRGMKRMKAEGDADSFGAYAEMSWFMTRGNISESVKDASGPRKG